MCASIYLELFQANMTFNSGWTFEEIVSFSLLKKWSSLQLFLDTICKNNNNVSLVFEIFNETFPIRITYFNRL